MSDEDVRKSLAAANERTGFFKPSTVEDMEKDINASKLKRVVIRLDDPRIVAVRAELLHSMPELTGTQINKASMLAVIVIARLAEKTQ